MAALCAVLSICVIFPSIQAPGAPLRETRVKADGIEIVGHLEEAGATFFDGDSIALSGEITWTKGDPPADLELSLWVGGRPDDGAVANQSTAKMTITSEKNRSGKARWHGSIEANWAGPGRYYVELTLVNNRAEYIKDRSGKIISWTVPVTVQEGRDGKKH